MPVERLINDIAVLLERELDLTGESKEIAVYGLYIFFSTCAGIISIAVTGWLLGVLGLSLVVVLTASGLRVMSGGAHSQCLRNCTLLGVILAPAMALGAKHIHGYLIPPAMLALVMAVGFISIWSIYRYAPADTPNKPIISESFKARLRRLSLLYTLAWSLLMTIMVSGLWIAPRYDIVLASTLGILWQSFSLTPMGYKLVAAVDALLP